jgi:aspartate-semialdehyde dehydrogenase
MAVTPLHKVAKVKRMIVSTYQAASGAGAAAMEELKEQTRDVLEGKEAKPVIFPYQVMPAWLVSAPAAAVCWQIAPAA